MDTKSLCFSHLVSAATSLQALEQSLSRIDVPAGTRELLGAIQSNLTNAMDVIQGEAYQELSTNTSREN